MGEKDPDPRPALLPDEGAMVDEHGRPPGVASRTGPGGGPPARPGPGGARSAGETRGTVRKERVGLRRPPHNLSARRVRAGGQRGE